MRLRVDGDDRSRRVPAVLGVWLLALCVVACSKSSRQSTPPDVTTSSAAVSASASATAGSPAASSATNATPFAAAPSAPETAPAASSSSGPPAASASAPVSLSRVETVKTVYDLLLDRYYHPLQSAPLLQNAWKGATQAAGNSSSGIDAPKLSGDRNGDWQAFSRQYAQLYAKAAGTVDGSALAFGAVNAIATGLHDDHTYFLSPSDNKRRQADDNGGERFIGVGVSLSGRAPFVVEAVVPGGPADKAGIQPGDTITALDGADLAKVSLDDLSSKLRGGAAGSTVNLTVKHGSGASDQVTVTRAEIAQPAIETRLLAGGIGYIALHNFSDAYARFADGRDIAETLDAALQSFERQGVKGWVFDVRGNPGGSEQTLAEVAGRFVPDGLVLVSIDRQNHTTEGPVDGHLFPVQRPLAVLIDGQSGSASELFAATMKEYGRARLFGQRTAGAVNGALETELPDGAAFQYTVVEGRTGKQRILLDGSGVSPDEMLSGGGGSDGILSGRTDQTYDRARQWLLEQAQKQATLPLQAPAYADALAPADLRAKLSPLAARMDDVPAGPARAKFGELTLTQPNELAIGIAADVPNAAAFAQRVRDRHWQGSYQQFFGSGEPPPYTVSIDLYRDSAGAHDAVATDDYPFDLTAVTPPQKLGDEAAAYAGANAADGIAQIVWRRGRVVFTVQYAANPGENGINAALALAKTLDARAASS